MTKFLSLFVMLFLLSCSQRLDVGTRGGDASQDAAFEASSAQDARLDGDTTIADGGADATSDAGSDCPGPVLHAATVNAGVGPSTKILRYSTSAKRPCDDFDVPKDDGLYGSLQHDGGLFVVRNVTIERIHPQTGATQWSVNYGNDYPQARRPAMFVIDYPNAQTNLAVAFAEGQLSAIFVLDPETGDEKDRLQMFTPSLISGYAGHPDGGPRFLTQRNSLYGLAEMVVSEGEAQAVSPYLLDDDIYLSTDWGRLRSYRFGSVSLVIWHDDDGIRFWRGESLLSSPLSNPRGPASCINIDCKSNDVAPDPNDSELFYLACNAGDLVRLDAMTGSCEVAIPKTDHTNFVIQSLEVVFPKSVTESDGASQGL